MNEESPELREARTFALNGDYGSAINLYVDILDNMKESPEYYEILIEYATSLSDSIFKQIMDEDVNEDEINDDACNAWECFQVALQQDISDDLKSDCHKGLGDLHALNKRFDEAEEEFYKAYYLTNLLELREEILVSFSRIFERSKDIDKLLNLHLETLELYKKNGDDGVICVENIKLLQRIKRQRKQETFDDDFVDLTPKLKKK